MSAPLIVACVWVNGNRKYSIRDVLRLRSMVHMWIPPNVDYEFICLTDSPLELKKKGISHVHIKDTDLPGWWSKMRLFEPTWRENRTVIYFDLDTALADTLKPLTSLPPSPLSICSNFTAAIHKKHWPCNYGSCVMCLGSELSGDLWYEFCKNKATLKKEAGRYGDQFVIEKLHPNATILQTAISKNYFLGYRDLKKHPKQKPGGCSVIVFAGGKDPMQIGPEWMRKVWASH